MSQQIPRVLSIAGTDPTGGAGIHADLKSIAANGGYGMAVATALVAQNTVGVRAIHRPPIEFLTQQLESVSDDVTIDAVKIGMLFDTEIIDAVSTWLDRVKPPCVVLDPVMVAASGDSLLTPSAEDALRQMLSTVDLVTPNLPELAALLDLPVATTWADALDQGRQLAERHDVRVLVKGGHLDGDDAPDALIDADECTEFHTARIATSHTHGTGCSLSSAIATLVPQHQNWPSAVAAAKSWLTESIAAASELGVGHGNGPVSHFAGMWRRAQKPRATPESIAQGWWEGIAQIRSDIDDLAFIRALSDGTLDESAFVWYLAQDALYLRDYSRALAAASQLAPTPEEQAFWAQGAHNAIVAELELHARWLPGDALFDPTASPVTTAYVDHLLATAARGSYDELVAALLPCYWIYDDVGARLSEGVTDDHPYAAWLKTYGDEQFHEATRQAIAIVSARAAAAPADVQGAMQAAFDASSLHELYFFAAPLRTADASPTKTP